MKPTLWDFLVALRVTRIEPRGPLAQIATQEGPAILMAGGSHGECAPIPFGVFASLGPVPA